jgi:hypothetical protein
LLLLVVVTTWAAAVAAWVGGARVRSNFKRPLAFAEEDKQREQKDKLQQRFATETTNFSFIGHTRYAYTRPRVRK